MKFIKEAGIIFSATMLGEILNAVLPFPIPSGVYGLFILLICLCSGIVKLGQVEMTGNFLLDIMPVMFIPAAVGLIESFSAVKAVLAPVFVISVVSTVIVMTVTGKTTEFVIKCFDKEKNGNE